MIYHGPQLNLWQARYANGDLVSASILWQFNSHHPFAAHKVVSLTDAQDRLAEVQRARRFELAPLARISAWITLVR